MEPTRPIGISHSAALRAILPSTKTGRLVQLESALERDFACLQEFDRYVAQYVEQPVRIEYQSPGTARLRYYTPDFLVRYVDERPPMLVEIKYRADLQAHLAEWKDKFRAAKHYAEAQNWNFCIYTEAEIQTPYLANAKFLLCFQPRSGTLREEYFHLLLTVIAALDETTPAEVLAVAFQDPDRRAELLPTLWYLISQGLVGCNLFQPLTMSSSLWHLGDEPLEPVTSAL